MTPSSQDDTLKTQSITLKHLKHAPPQKKTTHPLLPLENPVTRRRLAITLAALLAAASLLLAGGLAAAWRVPLPERLAQPGSTVVTWRDGSTAHVFLAPDDRWRVPATLEEVDPAYLEALQRLEDKRFQRHLGVDPLAILRAMVLNISRGQVVSGGSTLTMQLVRVLEPRPRTLSSKLIEALRAVQLELRLSKREILEAYLTFIPFGRNVEGVEAAALTYFGHSADALSIDEIAVLLAVPQNPNARYPTPAHQERLKEARDEIAARLVGYGLFTEDCRDELAEGEGDCGAAVLERVRGRPVPPKTRAFPRHVPHLATWLRQRHPEQRRIRTTLDRGVQTVADRELRREKGSLQLRGIHNAAAVIIDHDSAEVRALVGNLDFWDGEHGGQIAAFDAPRSPGSALKPFIYAMAIDRGLALPEFMVPDIPVRYGGYAPQNYDGQFSGLVRLEDALSLSLNIPFIELLGDLGVEPFLGLLRGAGVASLNPEPGHYGLSAAVGGIALTPMELAGLYTILANEGRYRPLRLRQRTEDNLEEDQRGISLLSPGAAWLTRRALAIKDRPDFPTRRQFNDAPAGIHWKTGTSFGHRDAWAVGSGPRYTAAVWCGNVDNSPSSQLVGSEAAGPLLFDLLEGLADRSAPPPHDPPPPDLRQIEVCAYSGHPVGSACGETRAAWAPTRSVPTDSCPFHVQRDVDEQSGLALTPTCRAGRSYRTETFLVWPASIRRWLKDQHRRLPSPPAWAPECTPPNKGGELVILSPPAGQSVFLMPGVPAERQEIALEAESDRAGQRLSWFVDGAYIGSAEAEERLWWTPKAGRHLVVVMDEAGTTDRRQVEVRTRPGG